MIEYPPHFPPRARARVERAMAHVEFKMSRAVTKNISVGLKQSIYSVLVVFERFVWELTDILPQQPGQWTAERLRSETTTFFDRLIEHVYTHSASLTPGWWSADSFRNVAPPESHDEGLRRFTAAVYQEVRTLQFWRNYQRNLVILSKRDAAAARPAVPMAESAAPAVEPAVPAAEVRTAVGARITALREQCGWEVMDLAKTTRIHKTTIYKHERGEVDARQSNLQAYANAFAKQLNREIAVDDLRPRTSPRSRHARLKR